MTTSFREKPVYLGLHASCFHDRVHHHGQVGRKPSPEDLADSGPGCKKFNVMSEFWHVKLLLRFKSNIPLERRTNSSNFIEFLERETKYEFSYSYLIFLSFSNEVVLGKNDANLPERRAGLGQNDAHMCVGVRFFLHGCMVGDMDKGFTSATLLLNEEVRLWRRVTDAYLQRPHLLVASLVL